MLEEPQFPTPHFTFGLTIPSMALPSTKTTKSPNNATVQASALESDAADKQRLLSKITSLEKTIEYMSLDHSSTLKDLHKEIARLQNACADLSIKKAQWTAKELNEASKVKKLQIKSLVVDPTSTTEPESTSLCVTLENQKSKYLKMIDRLSQENKKKAQSIDSLKTQLDFIRKALGMAGLEVDLQELQTLEVEKEEDASGTSKAQTQGAAAGVPIEVVSIPLMAQVKNKAPEVCIEKTLVPHPPANDTSNKVMESLASIGKSYIHHLLYTRKLEGDSIKLKERVEAELGKDSPFADAFTTVALKTEGNKSSSHQQALQVASQPNQIPLVNETSTDSEPQKKSWIAKKKAEFNKKAPLPPISGSQGDLISSSNESAPSESGKTFMTEAFNHSKTELLLRPVELGTDFADDISVSQWRSEINEALPEHQSLLGLNLGKSSRYAEKMARTKKLKETMARRR